MARVTKCDRCGAYFDYSDTVSVDSILLTKYDQEHDDYYPAGNDWNNGVHDLCADCVKLLEKWLNNE